MKTLRRIVFWLHLATGVSAGVVVLIMSVTGVLLTYEKQMLRWADTRTYRQPPPEAGAQRLPIDRLVRAVSDANGGAAATTVTVWADRSAPVAVAIGTRPVYVNPYTGAVLGGGSENLRAFFRRMTDWHRYLGAGVGPGRVTGRAITGACNLAFLFLVVSGFYLWMPKIWTWRQIRNIAWFKGGLRAKARDFNWHNAIGFWSAVPLAIVVFSGAVISYPWVSNLVYRIAGEAPPPPPQRASGAGGGGRGEAPGGGRVEMGRAGRLRADVGPRGTPGRRVEKHRRPPARVGRRARGLHDRSRGSGPAAEAGDAHAERVNRRGRSMGSVLEPHAGPQASIDSSLCAHRRGAGPRGTDDRGARVGGRGRARLHGHLARDTKVVGVAADAVE